MGHTVSKYGESKERAKTAQQTLHEMISETVQFLKECKKLTTDRLNCVDNLFKVCFNCKFVNCNVSFLFAKY